MMVEDKIRQARLKRAAILTAAFLHRGSLTYEEAAKWGVKLALLIETELDKKVGN